MSASSGPCYRSVPPAARVIGAVCAIVFVIAIGVVMERGACLGGVLSLLQLPSGCVDNHCHRTTCLDIVQTIW
eukprot:3831906-Rhodomonas_salina.2